MWFSLPVPELLRYWVLASLFLTQAGHTTIQPLSRVVLWTAISALVHLRCLLELKMGNITFPYLQRDCDEMFWVACKMAIYRTRCGGGLEAVYHLQFPLIASLFVLPCYVEYILLSEKFLEVVECLKYSENDRKCHHLPSRSFSSSSSPSFFLSSFLSLASNLI